MQMSEKTIPFMGTANPPKTQSHILLMLLRSVKILFLRPFVEFFVKHCSSSYHQFVQSKLLLQLSHMFSLSVANEKGWKNNNLNDWSKMMSNSDVKKLY